jgi:hypothetical protein
MNVARPACVVMETKSYAPRRIPSRRSVHSTKHRKVFGSVPAPSLRPLLATTHSVLIWRGVLFFYFVWWWRARSSFSKGETDGILSANSVDSVLPNYFLGIWIWQNRDCISRPQKRVWGMNAGGFWNPFWRFSKWRKRAIIKIWNENKVIGHLVLKNLYLLNLFFLFYLRQAVCWL